MSVGCDGRPLQVIKMQDSADLMRPTDNLV